MVRIHDRPCPAPPAAYAAAVEPVTVERLDVGGARRHRDALAAVLVDCVEGGASVSFMAPFTHDEARAFFESVEPGVAAGARVLLAAFLDDEVVGTVQVAAAWPPNQPHRADVAKLLVRRSARNRGIGRMLMERAEAEAREQGWTLLVLDTVTGDPARTPVRRHGLDEGRRDPELRPLPGRAALRHDRLLQRARSDTVTLGFRRRDRHGGRGISPQVGENGAGRGLHGGNRPFPPVRAS